MGVTVGGTSITFNDGTVQSTAMITPVATAGAVSNVGGVSGSHNNTNWVKGSSEIISIVSGSYRVYKYVSSAWTYDSKNGNWLRATGYAALYKNGVYQFEWSRNAADNPNQVVLVGTQDISVNKGDILSIYIRSTYAAYAVTGYFNLGVSTNPTGNYFLTKSPL